MCRRALEEEDKNTTVEGAEPKRQSLWHFASIATLASRDQIQNRLDGSSRCGANWCGSEGGRALVQTSTLLLSYDLHDERDRCRTYLQ